MIPFKNALILKFTPQKLNRIKMKPEDTNTPRQKPRTLAELAAKMNWFAGRLFSKQDKYLMGQVPSKGWTPGAGGLPVAGRDVPAAGLPSQEEVGQCFMPSGDRASGRSVKNYREVQSLFDRGYN